MKDEQRPLSYATDPLMLSLQASLCKDAKNQLGLVDQSHVFRMFESRNISQIREHALLVNENMSHLHYKWTVQLNSFLKRYTFHNDIYTPSERKELTNEKFIALQETLATNYWRSRTYRSHLIIRRARFHARRILDGFEPQGNVHQGKFGTKATVGCNRLHAYIDEKLLFRPLTGSIGHIRWLKAVAANDQLLSAILDSNKISFLPVSDLSLIHI